MKISGRREYLSGLESVAMTDIVLNMFIFFFISFSLLYTFSPQRIKQLEVKLPKAESASPIKAVPHVNITINNDGLVYLNGEPVTKEELKKKVITLIKKTPDTAVIVHSDRLTRFKEIVSVLNALTEAGVRNLNIAAVTE